MHRSRVLGIASLVLCTTIVSFAELAGSAPSRETTFSQSTQALLDREIAKARAAHPQAFLAVLELKKELPFLDAHKRGRLAPITQKLRAIGPDALFPMLAEINR